MSDTNLPKDIPAPAPRLRGDLTQGPILRTLVMFSIPALIANMLQTIGGSINAIWVAQLLGERAVAATANANMILFLMFGTIYGFGMATTIKVGQHFGARDIVAARRSFGAGIGFCTFLAVVAALLGFIYAEPVLRLMATPQEVMDQALAYLRITFISLPVMTVSLMVSLGLRGAGDATTPMFSMIVSVVIGIFLNPILIAGLGPIPALGIAGSAIAGAIGSLVGAVLMIATIYYKDLPLRLRGAERGFLSPNRAELGFILSKGLPMGAQTMLSTAAGLVMIGLVNREGMMHTAAYGASLQLWNYVQMPAFAVGTAVSSMVAQNVGAGQHERVGRITGAGIWATTAVTLVLTGLILVFDRPLLGLFLGDANSQAVPLARHIQFVASWSFVLIGVMMVLFSTMRSYGAVITPLIIMFVALYPMRIGFYYFAYPVIEADALWWSYPFSSLVAAVLAVLFYRYGRWRKPYASALDAQQMAVMPNPV